MRRLILFNMLTVDGYLEGRNEDISWHQVDGEVKDFIIEQMKNADTILFGRKTYEMMEKFWPSEKAIALDPVTAGMMKAHLKIVFSATLKEIQWDNTRQIKTDAVTEVENLKKQPGKDILIFGSATLCKELMKHGVIDEFRLMINPVTLGNGNRLFKHKKTYLRLLKAKVFGNGNMLLCYRPEKRMS